MIQNGQYDFAGRMTSLQLQYLWSDYWNYACPSGPEIEWAYAYQTESRTYDAGTGRLSSIAWSAISTPLASSNGGSLQYSWSATQNNGQITQMADTISGETVTYQYDALKRLVSACSSLNNCATAPTTFQYDGFGNLTSKTLAGVTSAIPVNAGTNQLSNAFYDANGNMTSGAGVTLTYDVANRVQSASPASGGTEYYGYAADNKRVWRLKSDGATEEWTLYGKSGERIGVYQWTGLQEHFDNWGNWTGDTAGFTALRTSLRFDGRLMQENGSWVLGDRLGTNRAGGARFLPYGEETSSTANDRVKFATYNRDGFTGLDYADQRYYASTYGRFNSPDPYAANAGPGVPLSWNRYAYVMGDPANLTDTRGLYVDCDDDDCSEADDCDGDVISCMMADDGGDSGDGDAGCTWIGATNTYSCPAGPSPELALAPTPSILSLIWNYFWPGFTNLTNGVVTLASSPVGVAAGITLGLPTSAGGRDEQCWDQYQADIAICRALGSQSCYDQAAQRYAACLANKPIPPFPYSPASPPRKPRPKAPKRPL